MAPLILSSSKPLKDKSLAARDAEPGHLTPAQAGAQEQERAARAAMLLSPVREGMDIEAQFPAVARQHVENLLSAFAYAVGARDATMLDELLRGVTVRLSGCPAPPPGSPGQSILGWFGSPRPAQLQTVNSIAVHWSGREAFYRATFQNWDASGPPACTGLGVYEGRLTAGPQVWRWTEHSILCPDVYSG